MTRPPLFVGLLSISRRKVDWWGLGILTYELLFGQTPFYRESKPRMFVAIQSELPKFPRGTDQATMSFISMLLEKNPEARGDFEKVHGHPFFAGLDFEKVLAREVQPAYVPVVGIKNFDSEYTREKPMDSFATPARQAHDAFEGFSCVGGPGEKENSSSEGEEVGLTPTTI
jgi:serine/threonine protein kinase